MRSKIVCFSHTKPIQNNSSDNTMATTRSCFSCAAFSKRLIRLNESKAKLIANQQALWNNQQKIPGKRWMSTTTSESAAKDDDSINKKTLLFYVLPIAVSAFTAVSAMRVN